jgi:hypothetical protein
LAARVARKARRERERLSTHKNGVPPRYKRRRPDAPASAVGVVDPELEHVDDDDLDLIGEHEHEFDPLDAQNAGQHERDFELGHEEIHLNLEAFDAPHVATPDATPAAHHEPDAPSGEPGAPKNERI